MIDRISNLSSRLSIHPLTKTFAAALVVLMSTVSHAGTLLSEPALYARCYAQLTGKPVPLGHIIAAAVRKGAVKAQDACNALLDKAALTENGQLANPNDPEGIAILNQFYNYHRSLFPVNSQEQIPHYSNEYAAGTGDIYDFTEPALAMTRVMLGNHQYKDLLTTLGSVRAIRQQDAYTKSIYGFTVDGPSRRIFGNNATFTNGGMTFRKDAGFAQDGSMSTLVYFPLIQVGDLVGVKMNTDHTVVPNLAIQPFAPQRGSETPGLQYSYDAFATSGGGVMGYPVYIMSYIGHQDGTFMDGALKVPRKWAQQSLKTFLCANMPDLRSSDVGQHLVSTSTVPFRTQTSCLGCHATMDQMAYTARNHIMAFSDFTRADNGNNTGLVPRFNATIPSVSGWPSEAVTNFHRQVPSGRFYYRSFTGILHDQAVSDMNGLGQAMTSTDDYYQCAAKHYFEMLTGNKVALFDRGNSANSDLLKTLTEQQIKDRKLIEELGTQLRADQSVKKLIRSIMATDHFRSVSYRP